MNQDKHCNRLIGFWIGLSLWYLMQYKLSFSFNAQFTPLFEFETLKIIIISYQKSRQYLHHRVHMFWRRAPVSPPCPPCWSARPRGSWTPSRFSTTCAFYQTLLCLKLISLTWELRTLCIFSYHSECCLVFAGYGAIVFMWQISLKRKAVIRVKNMSLTMNFIQYLYSN